MSYVEPRYDPYQVGLTQHGPSGVLSIKTKCYESNYSKKKKKNQIKQPQDEQEEWES